MAARWYIIHAYSGFENKVRDAILSEAERLGLSDGVEEVEVVLVFDPPWDVSRMSDVARLELGMM